MIGHQRPRTVAAVALAIALAATLWAWFIAGRQVEREAKRQFEQQASLAAGLLERRIQRYIDVLYGLEALAYHDQTLSRTRVRPLRVRARAGPALPRRAGGASSCAGVTDDERDEFVRRVRRPKAFPTSTSAPPGAATSTGWSTTTSRARATNR